MSEARCQNRRFAPAFGRDFELSTDTFANLGLRLDPDQARQLAGFEEARSDL